MATSPTAPDQPDNTGPEPEPRHSPDPSPRPALPSRKAREALRARDALANALTRAGIQLPALDVRTPWVDDREGQPSYMLVNLGVCSAPVAHALAAAIMKGIR